MTEEARCGTCGAPPKRYGLVACSSCDRAGLCAPCALACSIDDAIDDAWREENGQDDQVAIELPAYDVADDRDEEL